MAQYNAKESILSVLFGLGYIFYGLWNIIKFSFILVLLAVVFVIEWFHEHAELRKDAQ